MQSIEIIVIISCILIVGGCIVKHIYRKENNLPTGECACCKNINAGNKLVKKYHKKYCKNK